MKQAPIDKFAKWWVSEKGQLELRRIRERFKVTWSLIDEEKDNAKDWLIRYEDTKAQRMKDPYRWFNNWIRKEVKGWRNPLITKDMEDEREYYKRVTANIARKIED